MWGRPMKDEQEGNPKTRDMAIPILVGGGCRLSFQLEVVGELSEEQQLLVVELGVELED
ncbi:hypothetical protein LINPERHAP2_LOCUS17096 [Linum perenne]